MRQELSELRGECVDKMQRRYVHQYTLCKYLFCGKKLTLRSKFIFLLCRWWQRTGVCQVQLLRYHSWFLLLHPDSIVIAMNYSLLLFPSLFWSSMLHWCLSIQHSELYLNNFSLFIIFLGVSTLSPLLF